jgi:hypothetical protein
VFLSELVAVAEAWHELVYIVGSDEEGVLAQELEAGRGSNRIGALAYSYRVPPFCDNLSPS